MDDGQLPLDELAQAIRAEDVHCARGPRLPGKHHNMCGGRVLPRLWPKLPSCAARAALSRLDGARIGNAAVALDVSLATVAAECDTVSMCLSKTPGAPLVAAGFGAASFIGPSHSCGVGGGGMRQEGFVAATGRSHG